MWFPDWPIQRRLRERGSSSRPLLVLTEPGKRGVRVRYASASARRRGIRPGLPLAEAQALVHPQDALEVQPLEPETERKALGALALGWAAYSDQLGLEEEPCPECVGLDLAGTAIHWGGEQKLAERLQAAARRQGWEVRVAVADTWGQAWAAAHFLADARQPRIVPSPSLAALSALPVEGLRLPALDLCKLRRVGIATLQQLLTLDRSALASRLSMAARMRWEQFLGQRPERLVPCQSAERPRRAMHWETPLPAEGVLPAVERLLEELLAPLRTRRLGTRRVVLHFFLEPRQMREVSVRLCQQSADPRAIAGLVRLHLERLAWPAGVVGIEVEACEVAALPLVMREWDQTPPRPDQQGLDELWNQLASRLGTSAVCWARLAPDPVPERAVQWMVVVEASPETEPTNWARYPLALGPHDRPTGLFAWPRRIEVVPGPGGVPRTVCWRGQRWDVVRHRGPERIEAEGWTGKAVCRDYYHVQTAEGRWLWLFCQPQDGRWFWHGELL